MCLTNMILVICLHNQHVGALSIKLFQDSHSAAGFENTKRFAYFIPRKHLLVVHQSSVKVSMDWASIAHCFCLFHWSVYHLCNAFLSASGGLG